MYTDVGPLQAWTSTLYEQRIVPTAVVAYLFTDFFLDIPHISSCLLTLSVACSMVVNLPVVFNIIVRLISRHVAFNFM
uniref:G protein-coupled receptor n=1 Tax=Steinernema glaseri TaxID=37863 RepID=A0A1I7Z2Y8_9BILA